MGAGWQGAQPSEVMVERDLVVRMLREIEIGYVTGLVSKFTYGERMTITDLLRDAGVRV